MKLSGLTRFTLCWAKTVLKTVLTPWGEYKLLTSPENALVAEVTSVTSSGNPGWLPPPTQRVAND